MSTIFLFTIFVLACFIGYFAVLGVTPVLHSPLMSVTNAISGIVIIGALYAATNSLPKSTSEILSLSAIFLASFNIFGGFTVSERMLTMFKKKENKNAKQ